MLFTVFGLFCEAAFAFWLISHTRIAETRKERFTAALVLLISFLARGIAFHYEGKPEWDYLMYLHPWMEALRAGGGFKALSQQIGNYNVVYMYFLALFTYIPVRDLLLIKLLSCLFDVVLAWGCALIVRALGGECCKQLITFLSVLCLPTVFLNSAVWGQCDSIYAAFAVLAIYLALSGRPVLSVVCFTISFGFKQQAVFVLPLILIFMFSGGYKPIHLVAIPVTYLLLILPALSIGKPFWETILIYYTQAKTAPAELSMNAPNLCAVFSEISHLYESAAVAKASISLAALYSLTLIVKAYAMRKNISDRTILIFAILLAVGVPFLLPHMHERYFYIAEMLSIIYAAMTGKYIIPLLLQLAAINSYYAAMTSTILLPMTCGAAMIVAATLLMLVTENRSQNDILRS